MAAPHGPVAEYRAEYRATCRLVAEYGSTAADGTRQRLSRAYTTTLLR
jgi:hypothetical protein